MAKPPRVETVAAELLVQERVLLFCVATGTDWQKADVAGDTTTVMVVKGLIDRDTAGRLTLTNAGRQVLRALLKNVL